MAELRITIDRDADWLPGDQLQLLVGSENAASLAASSPSGGRVVQTVSAAGSAQERAEWGDTLPLPPIVLTHQVNPSDKCATLPVGARVLDAAGNASAIVETTVAIADPPRGARNLQVSATVNLHEAELTWIASPDF